MDTITDERKSLRSRARICRDEMQVSSLREQAAKLSGQLSLMRREVKLCEGVWTRSLEMPQKLNKAKQEEQQLEQEMIKHEHKRGRSRPGREHVVAGR
jgi:hypothetical protein